MAAPIPTNFLRSIRLAYIAILVLIASAGCAAHLAAESAGHQMKGSPIIRAELYRSHNSTGGESPRTITVSDANELRELLSYLPQFGKHIQSEAGFGGWVCELTITFMKADGTKAGLMSNYSRWNEGENEFASRDGFGRFVDQLFSKHPRQPSDRPNQGP